MPSTPDHGPSAQPLVLYHAKCNDGLTAAWCVRLVEPLAEFVAVDYQNPPPNVENRQVILVDFSFKRPVLEQLLASCESLLILDHHDSAQKDLAGLEHPKLRVTFDMDRSGAGIAWDHYHPGKLRPWFVDVVEDADLWRWNKPETLLNPDSRAIIEGIRSLPMTFHTLDRLNDTDAAMYDCDMAAMRRDGEAILRAKEQNVKAVAEYAYEVEVFGHRVLIANAPHVLCSEVAHELAKGRPFGMTYYETKDRRFKISVRSTDFDTTTITKQWGGGGHKAASGATVDQLPWRT
jgi:oligoribonuclease NrnB/cAMP/cGMP phosphodiesterase (DHH superfamily)